MLEGIDISIYNVRQGPINWQEVRQAGKEFVMIRAGWANYAGRIYEDTTLQESAEGAFQAGLQVGLYLYDYCADEAAHRAAAKNLVEIAGRFQGKLTMPLALDVEETALPVLTDQGKTGLTNGIIAFCDELQQEKYYAMWYSYTAFIQQYLERDRLRPYDLWLADYRATPWNTPHGMLQYKGGGQCLGIQGPCDLDRAYKDYPAILRSAGLNHLEEETVDYKALYLEYQQKLKEVEREYTALKQKVNRFVSSLNEE